MKVIDNITFGLGYYDPRVDGIKEVSDIKISINPFETKTYKFYIYGQKITNNSIINIVSNIESLVQANKVALSMSATNGRKFWTNSDTQITRDGVNLYPLLVTITNTHYSELNTNLILDLSLQSTIGSKATSLSYYGDLIDKDNYKVLPRDVENKSKRTVVIDPRPDGADYTYLSYSSGDTLIFLDDNTAIPYTPVSPQVVQSMAAMSMPDAGYYLWDDGEIIDWDTDINTEVSQTNAIADDKGNKLVSDDGIGYQSEDNKIEGE